jgi:hypothetical protein
MNTQSPPLPLRSSRAVENALRRAYKNTRSRQTQILLRQYLLRQRRTTDFEFEKYCQLFVRADNETLSVVAMGVSNEDSSPWQSHQQGQLLEQAKQFEHDYDNDNYPDYVEDASVHAVD